LSIAYHAPVDALKLTGSENSLVSKPPPGRAYVSAVADEYFVTSEPDVDPNTPEPVGPPKRDFGAVEP
jgi:hypothetical protein